jgi:bifunctional non-homologous end joining protein LigD
LNYPDFIVFDLDPYLYSGNEADGAEPELHGAGFAKTTQVALWLKEMLDAVGLKSFVKTTGRTGLHIYCPIKRILTYEQTHAMSEVIARHMAQQHPNDVTVEWAVKKRTGKVFVDYNQNARGKTLASIYSPRALPQAPVSVPVEWSELAAGRIYPTNFTLRTVERRIREVGDLWANILAFASDVDHLVDAANPS